MDLRNDFQQAVGQEEATLQAVTRVAEMQFSVGEQISFYRPLWSVNFTILSDNRFAKH
jgi:hypothetical protein